MKLVIDIDEYLYKAIQSYKNPTEEETAIANGTPLNKIRAEIEERKLNSGGEPNRELAFNVCLQIIDKYISGKDQK